MILSSFILLIMGMGTTFVFLFVLIICTNISSKVSSKYAYLMPEPELKKVKPVAKPAAAAGNDDEIAAAIAVAIVKHAGK